MDMTLRASGQLSASGLSFKEKLEIAKLLEKLREGRSLSSSDVWERLAATVACKAAIKGGWVTEREELLALAEKVLAGEVTHCPHGRPVMTVFTRAELDKRFGRIV